jgi:FtsP/CotA-like multicopper oxidase with cupredoxin domain
VCKGDLIVVDVVNQLSSDTTSIHWHGVHQIGTPYMDGVPFVTQCPISPMTTFRYRFWAEYPGTHFYHSHSGKSVLD